MKRIVLFVICTSIVILFSVIFLGVKSNTSDSFSTSMEHVEITPTETKVISISLPSGINTIFCIKHVDGSYSVRIKDPDNSVIHESAYNNTLIDNYPCSLISSFVTDTSGTYTAEITNRGNNSIIIQRILFEAAFTKPI